MDSFQLDHVIGHSGVDAEPRLGPSARFHRPGASFLQAKPDVDVAR